MSKDVPEGGEIAHDDPDLMAVRGHRAGLAHLDDDTMAAARERLAALEGSDLPLGRACATGRGGARRPVRIVASLASVAVAAAVLAVAVWAAPGGRRGWAPAAPALTSTVTSAPTSTAAPSSASASDAGTPMPTVLVPRGQSMPPSQPGVVYRWADPVEESGLFAEGGALHCMALHDEPLGEVARKLAKTDLQVVYSLPETESASGAEERWTQAQAEADTTMKVSEVMQRSSTRVEVYFWTKDNKDFEPQEMKDAFAQRCPDPR